MLTGDIDICRVVLWGQGGLRLLLPRKGNEGLKFRAGGAGIEGLGGERGGFAEIAGAAGGDERGGGVGEDNIAPRAFFAREDAADQLGVVGGLAARDRFARGAREAEIFRRDGKGPHRLPDKLGDESFSGQ
jgi:hypothetical protein